MREGSASERLAGKLSALDPQWDAVRTEHALAALHRRRRRRRALLAGAALTTAIAAAALIGLAPSAPEAPVARAPEAATEAPAPSALSPLRFADGSVVTPDAEAEVILDTVSDERIALQLDAGSISVEVTPRPERAFEIDCGAVQVSVLGTGFTLERREERTFVQVIHGRVRVAWEGGERVLGAGEEGLFPEAVEGGHGAPVATLPEPARPRPRPTEIPSAPSRIDWRPLAERGDYEAAYEALATGEVDDEVETLLLAADAARLSGHGAAALPYLERAASHEDDPRALLASFTRGRILVSLGRAREGAAELERVIARAPTGALAEDAVARAIEAHQRAGDDARARELARQYLREHPGGRWAERAEAALEPR